MAATPCKTKTMFPLASLPALQHLQFAGTHQIGFPGSPTYEEASYASIPEVVSAMTIVS